VLGICASGSGIGKTTLLTQLVPALAARGLKVSFIKHAHHAFDIDHPGKDTYRIRESGAVQTLIGSRHRWALMTELSHTDPDRQEPDLAELLPHIDTSIVDLILVEGFKQEPIPKIEVYRPSVGAPLLAASDPTIVAVASDGNVNTLLPVLDLNNADDIAMFVATWLQQQSSL
jgi:molybdopterin-guanine dinucleotide biosynthesis protein B